MILYREFPLITENDLSPILKISVKNTYLINQSWNSFAFQTLLFLSGFCILSMNFCCCFLSVFRHPTRRATFFDKSLTWLARFGALTSTVFQ